MYHAPINAVLVTLRWDERKKQILPLDRPVLVLPSHLIPECLSDEQMLAQAVTAWEACDADGENLRVWAYAKTGEWLRVRVTPVAVG